MRDESAAKKKAGPSSGGLGISDTGMDLRGLSKLVDADNLAGGDETLIQIACVSIPPHWKDDAPKQQPTQSVEGRNVARRSAKIALASIVALAGIYAALVQRRVVTSDEAIVSAY